MFWRHYILILLFVLTIGSSIILPLITGYPIYPFLLAALVIWLLAVCWLLFKYRNYLYMPALCFFLAILVVLGMAVTVHRPTFEKLTNDNRITLTFLQLNDVYEISGLEEGRTGGLARVAHFRKALASQHPGTTYALLAGDFLSPSAMGQITDGNKQAIAGKQMVAVLNEMGLDLATFGNHEFDLKPRQLQECIDSSRFDWVSTNTLDTIEKFTRTFMKAQDDAATPIPSVLKKTFRDKDGTTVTVGFFGLTIESSAGDYVAYEDYEAATARAIRELKDNCDFIVGLTHLSMDIDKKLALRFPEISLIIGGHEHVNSYNVIGKTPIAKADANAKTVYVHTLDFDRRTKQLTIRSKLVAINNKLAEDEATQQVIASWNRRADSLLRKDFKPCHAVATLPVVFDGTEKSVRQDTTNLTLAIARAMLQEAQKAPKDKSPVSCVLYNSGSIRLDDVLKGTITEYDIFRIMPYPGKILVATIKGKVLDSLLTISNDSCKGEGCFLQHTGNIQKDGRRWKINNRVIKPGDDYKVVINDYLLGGRQDRMKFLKNYTFNPVDTLKVDIRKVVMNYLSTLYPPASNDKSHLLLPCYPSPVSP